MEGVSHPPPLCHYLKSYFEQITVLGYLSALRSQCQTKKKDERLALCSLLLNK